jgi:hypothetical protein
MRTFKATARFGVSHSLPASYMAGGGRTGAGRGGLHLCGRQRTPSWALVIVWCRSLAVPIVRSLCTVLEIRTERHGSLWAPGCYAHMLFLLNVGGTVKQSLPVQLRLPESRPPRTRARAARTSVSFDSSNLVVIFDLFMRSLLQRVSASAIHFPARAGTATALDCSARHQQVGKSAS